MVRLLSSSPPALRAPRAVVAVCGVLVLCHLLLPASLTFSLGFVPARCVESLWSCFPTLFTYGLLHGSWEHVLVNGFFLLAFGTPVARRLTTTGFLTLIAASVVAGALIHFALYHLSIQPLVGASAGVSGLVAATTRFSFLPGGELFQPSFNSTPARRAAGFIFVWLMLNFFVGLTSTNIAWEAHVGGFAAGFFLFPLLARR